MYLSNNDSKLDKLSAEIELLKNEQKEQIKPKAGDTGIGIGLSLATSFISAVIIGVCVGIFLDKIFGTSFIFLIIFLIFGVTAGFLNCYRFEKKYNEENEKNKRLGD